MDETFSEKWALELVKQIGPIASFQPCAYYRAGGDIVVLTEDCSYCAERVSDCVEIFWQNHRPWYAPWKKCVGFSLYAPVHSTDGGMPVTDVLDLVAAQFPNKFGKYRGRLYHLAENLKVYIP